MLILYIEFNRFKTTDGHQKHCDKQGRFKCDVCFELFCTKTALEIHNEDCVRTVEEFEEIETKPTFIYCDSDVKVTAESLPQQWTELEEEVDAKPEKETIETNEKPEVEQETMLTQQQKQISFSVSAIGYAMSPMQIEMDVGEMSDTTILRNTFPKDQSDREYLCYLCDRKYVRIICNDKITKTSFF